MSIRGLHATGSQLYMNGGQIVNVSYTIYGVPGTAQTDLATIQQALYAAGSSLTPQQVLAAGGVDEYAVGSVGINLATSAVQQAVNYYAKQTPAPSAPAPSTPAPSTPTSSGSNGGTTSGPYAPYTPYTPAPTPAPVYTAPPPTPAYTPPPVYTAPTPAPTYTPAPVYTAPATAPAATIPAATTPTTSSYSFVSNDQPPGGIYSDAFNTVLPTDGTTPTAPAAAAPGLMSTLSAIPWYYYAGGAAAALFLFSGSTSRR